MLQTGNCSTLRAVSILRIPNGVFHYSMY